MTYLKRFLLDEEATAATEYAVMLALILVVIIATVRAVGTTNGGMWSNTASQLNSVM
jgi:Flp pilus assembly pilin Flp